MDLETMERPYLAIAWMEGRQGGYLVPVIGEVHHHSSYLKKLKKLPNKYGTLYKYTMQYIR
jgi:hypothetical protein